MQPDLTIQDLAEAAHAAYVNAPQSERWQAVARSILQKLNDRSSVCALQLIEADGRISELVPGPREKAPLPVESTPDVG